LASLLVVSEQALLRNEFLGVRHRIRRAGYAHPGSEPDTDRRQAHRCERLREHDRACEEWVWLGLWWRGRVVTALWMRLRERRGGGELKEIDGGLA
jgi:hypothetical protein